MEVVGYSSLYNDEKKGEIIGSWNMNVHPCFPEQYSHILRHMVKIFWDCDCAIIHYPNGEAKPRNPNAVGDPAVANHLGALRAMEAVGLIINVAKESDSTMYFPTVSGRYYLERCEHPLRIWLKENWFAFTVLLVTTGVNLIALLLK